MSGQRLLGDYAQQEGPEDTPFTKAIRNELVKVGTSITKCSVMTNPSVRIAVYPGTLEHWNAFCSRELNAFD